MTQGNLRKGAQPGRLSAVLLAGLGLSACTAPAALQPLRLEPHLRVEHAGPGLAQGYVALALRYEGDAPAPTASAVAPSAPQDQVQAQGLIPTQVPAIPPEQAVPPPTSPLRRVEIANGNGVPGMAACVAERLRALGAADSARLRNALPYNTTTTVVRYRAGHDQAARALARQLPRTGSGDVPAVAGVDRADSLDVRLVLGHDLRASDLCTRPR